MNRWLLVTIVIAGLAAGGCAETGLVGGDLFEQRCASCHGGGGAGGRGPALDAGSDAVDLTDEQIAGVIEVGPGAMPSFGNLSEDQIDSLVDHIRSLQRAP